MPEWIALSRTEHAALHYNPRPGYGFAATQTAAPALLSELSLLVAEYPLGFIMDADGPLAVALLGLTRQRNLYLLPDQRWVARYVPACVRGYPFTLATSEHGQVLAVDSAQLGGPEQFGDASQPLFDSDGQLSGAVKRQLIFLQECHKQRQLTRAASAALQQAGVLEPWPLQLRTPDGDTSPTVSGLYRVSQTALDALDDRTYATLRGAPMQLAQAQRLSMARLAQLAERAQQTQARQATPAVLDTLFDSDDDMTFDFGQ